MTREPAYEKTAASHAAQDWGTTYLEVDLSAQHMWYIVNGAIALETDVVTGLPDAKHATPAGVYSILYTEPDSKLIGEKRSGNRETDLRNVCPLLDAVYLSRTWLS